MIPNSVSANVNPHSLDLVSKIYSEEADEQRKVGRSNQGAELIRDIAAFKARVQRVTAKRRRAAVHRRRSGADKAFLVSEEFCERDNFQIPLQLSKNHIRLAKDKPSCKCCYIVRIIRFNL